MVEAAQARGINTTISPDVDAAAAAVEDINRVAPAGSPARASAQTSSFVEAVVHFHVTLKRMGRPVFNLIGSHGRAIGSRSTGSA